MRYFITLRSSFQAVTIKDDNENVIYKIRSAKKITMGYNVHFINESDEVVFEIVKKGMSGKYRIMQDGKELAVLKKAMSLLKPKVTITSTEGNFTVKGNFNKHKYTISNNGKLLATISKKFVNLKNEFFFDAHSSDGIELVMAIAIVLDDLAYQHEQSLQRSNYDE